jgi:hypothetical protein
MALLPVGPVRRPQPPAGTHPWVVARGGSTGFAPVLQPKESPLSEDAYEMLFLAAAVAGLLAALLRPPEET